MFFYMIIKISALGTVIAVPFNRELISIKQHWGTDMISPFDSGISAISAFSVKMNVTANNVANLNSDGFKKSRTTLKEGPFGGVEPDVDQVNTPGYIKQISENGEIREVEASNVDLAEEFTDLMLTQSGFKANLKTIQAYDEMLGTLLDTIG